MFKKFESLGRFGGWVIFLATFICYILFSNLMPITDPVESNYLLTAKEMALSGDWIVPRIYGQVWFDKPPLLYWLLALNFKFFGSSAIGARAIPAFFSAASVSLVYWFASRIYDKRKGLIAAVILATSFQFLFMAKLVITDTLLFLFSSGAVAFFYLGYMSFNQSKKWHMLVYPCMGLAVLVKGPVGVLLPGVIILSFLAMQNKLSELRAMYVLPGIVMFVSIVVPWYLEMYLTYKGEFIRSFFGVHNYLRAITSEHPKDNVFYFYPVVLVVGMLPWSGIALSGLLSGYRKIRQCGCTKSLILLLWASAYFVFYSLMATKYLTYTFPMLFPMAILAADYIDTLPAGVQPKKLFWLAGLPLVILVLSYSYLSYKYLVDTLFLLNISGMLIMTVWALWRAKQDGAEVFAKLAMCALGVFILLSATVLPKAAVIRSGQAIAEEVKLLSNYRIGIIGDYSTSAVYYSGQTIVRLTLEPYLPPPSDQELDWTSKYKMPTESLRTFIKTSPFQSGIVVIVRTDRLPEFKLAVADCEFTTIFTNEDFSIFKLVELR